MTIKLRPLYVVLALSLALTGVSHAFPEWTENAGLDFWNENQMQLDLNVANRRGRDLEEQSHTIAQRLEYRESVIQDLFAARIVFSEAVARFRFLCETQPDAMRLLKQNFAGESVDESVAKQVWSFAQVYLRVIPPNDPLRNRLLNEAGELLPADYVARTR